MRIFVSYHTRDTSLVEQVVSALPEVVPDCRVYFAPQSNVGGAYWVPRLEQELAESDLVLLFLGESVGSWQELEYYEALRLNRAKSGVPRILPILISGFRPGLPFLGQFHRVNLSGAELEPLKREIAAFLQPTNERTQPRRPWLETNPYVGLAAMGAEEAGLFFGREGICVNLITHLRNRPDRLLMLVGSSGVGKSSLVEAGLLPSLRSQMWPGDPDQAWPQDLADSKAMLMLSMRPGGDPLKALALSFTKTWSQGRANAVAEAIKWVENFQAGATLGDLASAARQEAAERSGGAPPSKLLLYIDQFEELYTQADPNDADLFSTLLRDAVEDSDLLLIGSLRSDHYGHLQCDAHLFATANVVDVPPMTGRDIEDVIDKPAAALGVRIEPPEAVPALAEATAQEIGGLPLLSYLLSAAWEKMQSEAAANGILTLPVSEINVGQPLIERAERFIELHEAEKETLRALFTLRLAHVSRDGQPVRRRTVESECSPGEWRLAQALCERDWRLLTATEEAGEPAIQVAHEMLLRRWPRLTSWIEQEFEFLAWRAQLDQSRAAWEALDESGRDDALLMGLALANARAWLKSRAEDISDQDRLFIEASQAHDDAGRARIERRKAELAEERERSRNRAIWLSRVSVAAAIILPLLGGGAGWLFIMEREARYREDVATQLAAQQAARTEAEAKRALALNLAAVADRTLDENTGETGAAAMIALDSLNQTGTEGALQVLRRALSYKPANDPLVDVPWRGTVTFSKDGGIAAWTRRDMFYAGSDAEKVGVDTQIAFLDALDLSEVARGAVPGGAEIALSHDGATWVASGEMRALHFGATDDWRPQKANLQIGDMAALFHEDEERLVVVHEDGRVELRHAPDWTPAGELKFPRSGETRSLYAALAGETLVVLEDETWDGALTFVPLDGSAPIKGEIRMNKLAQAHLAGYPTSLAASGRWAITSHSDRTVRLWDARIGTVAKEFTIDGAQGMPSYPAISTDGLIAGAGSRVKSSEGENTIYESVIALWDANGAEAFEGWTYPGLAREIAFSPDATRLAVGGENGLDLRTVAPGPVSRLLAGEKVTAMTFDASGSLLVGTQTGRLLRINPETATVLAEKELGARIAQIAADRSGARLGIVFGDGRDAANWSDVAIVEQRSGRSLAHWSVNGPLTAPHLSSDGRVLAAEHWGKDEIMLWSAADGRLLDTVPIDGVFSGFSPSDENLLVDDYKLRIHNRKTGRVQAELGEPGGVSNVNWPSKDDLAVVRDFDGGTSIWNLATGQRGQTIPSTRWRSPDGKIALIFDADLETLKVVAAETAEDIGRVDGPRPLSAAVTNDGRTALLVYASGEAASSEKLEIRDIFLTDVESGDAMWSKRVEVAASYRLVLSEANSTGALSVSGAGLSQDGYLQHWLLYFPPGHHTPWEATHPKGWSIEHKDSDRTGRYVALSEPRALEIRDALTGDSLWRNERPHTDRSVEAPIFFPDGDRLMTVKRLSDDPVVTRIHILRTENGQVLHEQTVDGFIQASDVSADGNQAVVVIDKDGGQALYVFDTVSGSERAVIPLHSFPNEVRFLKDPNLIAVWDHDSVLTVWDISAGSALHQISPSVTASEYVHASDAMRAATAKGRSLRLWDTERFEEVASLIADGKINHVSLSPDGQTLVFFAESDRVGSSVGVWAPEAEVPIWRIPAEMVSNIVFSPNGAQIAIRSRELRPEKSAWIQQAVRVIDIATLSPVFSMRALPHGELIWTGFSADGAYLLNVERAQFEGRGTNIRLSMLRVFDLTTGTEIARRSLGSSDIVAVPGGSEVIYQGADFRARRLTLPGERLDAIRAKNNGELRTARGSTTTLAENYWGPTQVFDGGAEANVINLSERDGAYNVLKAKLSPNGSQVLLSLRESDWSIDSGGRAELRDAASGDLRHQALDWPNFFNGAWIANDDVAFLSRHEGNTVRKGDDFGLVWWNAKSGETRTLIDDKPLAFAAVSPDGTLFAAALGAKDADGNPVGEPEISVWDVATGAHKFSLPTDLTYGQLAFSENNRYLASAALNQQLVFDLETREIAFATGRAASHTVHTSQDNAMDSHVQMHNGYRPAFALEGDVFVLISDQAIILHNLTDGVTERLIERGKISGSTVSAEGRYAAVITGETTANVWDLEARERIISIPLAELRQLAFAGDDASTLLARTDEGVVELTWRPEALIERTCRVYGGGDWAKSRFRMTGAKDPGVCAAMTSGAQSMKANANIKP